MLTCSICGKRLRSDARNGLCNMHRKLRRKPGPGCDQCSAPLHFATKGSTCRRCLARLKAGGSLHATGSVCRNWRGGRYDEGANRYIQVWTAPRSRRREHRVVAETLLGRPLRVGEVVHHVDENKKKNADTKGKKKAPPAVVVLLSDGYSTTGPPPLRAAQHAKQLNLSLIHI